MNKYKITYFDNKEQCEEAYMHTAHALLAAIAVADCNKWTGKVECAVVVIERCGGLPDWVNEGYDADTPLLVIVATPSDDTAQCWCYGGDFDDVDGYGTLICEAKPA